MRDSQQGQAPAVNWTKFQTTPGAFWDVCYDKVKLVEGSDYEGPWLRRRPFESTGPDMSSETMMALHRQINPDWPVALYGEPWAYFKTGLVMPFVQRCAPTDSELSQALLDIYARTGLVLMGATPESDFFQVDVDGRVRCTDVTYAYSPDATHDQVSFAEDQVAFQRFWWAHSLLNPLTVKTIHLLLVLQTKPELNKAAILPHLTAEIIGRLSYENNLYLSRNYAKLLDDLSDAVTQLECDSKREAAAEEGFAEADEQSGFRGESQGAVAVAQKDDPKLTAAAEEGIVEADEQSGFRGEPQGAVAAAQKDDPKLTAALEIIAAVKRDNLVDDEKFQSYCDFALQQCRETNMDLKRLEPLLVNKAKELFTHRHKVLRIIADMIFVPLGIATLGILFVAKDRITGSALFSTATPRRRELLEEKLITKIAPPAPAA